MLSSVVSRIIILSAGVVYPAYSSYKSVKEKNVKGYIKWLMYWVVYALFASVESIADMFVAWIPFYYEMKILILLWLVSPASRGSIQFYVRCLHPLLTKRENEIDTCLSHLKDLLYFTVIRLFRYLFNILRSSVSMGHGLILDQIKMRYGLQDVVDKAEEERNDESEAEEDFIGLEEEGDLPIETVVAKHEISSQSVLAVASQATTAVVSADTPLPSSTIPTPVTTTDTSSPVLAHSTDPDSMSSTSGHRKPLSSRDAISSYDRYTRLAYAPFSSSSAHSSSYSSASTGAAPRTYAGSSLYDRYTRPTTSSSSRYSSSTSTSSKTTSYSSRYSKK